MFFTSVIASNTYAKTQPANGDDNTTTTKKVSTGALLFLLIVFLIEFSLFIWALTLAWKCGKRHKDRFVHVLAAFCCPIIYIIYYFVAGCSKFDDCGVDVAPGAK